MNTRLQTLYKDLEESNKQKFLDNELELDPMWGKKIQGTVLQIDLSESVRDTVVQYQRELGELEPDALLLLPRPYQHISVNQIVFWNGTYTLGHEGTWNSIKDTFLANFQKLDHSIPSFSVTFSKLIALPSAIIWCATDAADEIENLRKLLREHLPFPEETKKENHLIHTTVARFKRPLQNPQKIIDWIDHQHQEVSMKVETIFLRKENIYPSINTTELARIQLA